MSRLEPHTKDCTKNKYTCTNCTENHRTKDCLNTAKKCVSCKSGNHSSWNHNCLTFIKKTNKFNTRNPNNTLQFFPMDKPWTWTANNKPATTNNNNFPPLTYPNRTQHSTRTHQKTRYLDTYLPETRRQADSYIPHYRTRQPPAPPTRNTATSGSHNAQTAATNATSMMTTTTPQGHTKPHNQQPDTNKQTKPSNVNMSTATPTGMNHTRDPTNHSPTQNNA